VIAYLKAGSEAVPADGVAPAAPGWLAVRVPGPFEGYVRNRDLSKSLDVKPGSPVYLRPREDSGVLTTAAKGDHSEITGLTGRWTRVRLSGDKVGYIQTAAAPVADTALLPAPVLPAPETPAGAGKPARGFGGENADAALFPRLLEGRFVSTSNVLPFHKPYPWQLLDEAGERRAYLDVSRLLQTEQMDRYVNREVIVSGTMKELPSGKDIVVEVESLSLK
jgi:hypothetical protein